MERSLVEWVHSSRGGRSVHLLSAGRDHLLPVVLDFVRVNVADIKDEWLDLSRLVPVAVVDLLDEVALTLDAAVGDLADLLRVERLPGLVVQVLVERHDEDGVDEVDEGVANVAHVVEVKRQVEVVVSALVMPVDALKQHLFRVLVGYVADHNRRSVVLSVQDAVQVNHELGVLPLARVLLRCLLSLGLNRRVEIELGGGAWLIIHLREGHVLVVADTVAVRVLHALGHSLPVRASQALGELLSRWLARLRSARELGVFELKMVSCLRTSKVCRQVLLGLMAHQICRIRIWIL